MTHKPTHNLTYTETLTHILIYSMTHILTHKPTHNLTYTDTLTHAV